MQSHWGLLKEALPNKVCFQDYSTVVKWRRHWMETSSTSLALSAGNSPVTGEFPSQRPALMVSLIWAWTNGWVINRDAVDLRRHRAHYDVTVMSHDKMSILISKWFGCCTQLGNYMYNSVSYMYTYITIYTPNDSSHLTASRAIADRKWSFWENDDNIESFVCRPGWNLNTKQHNYAHIYTYIYILLFVCFSQ